MGFFSLLRNSRALYAILTFMLAAGIGFPGLNVPDVDMTDVTVPDGFEEQLNADAFENSADVRVMSYNVLVDFDWGSGVNPVQPRAAKFFKMLEAYSPDVIGVQEQSRAWTSVFVQYLPNGYKVINPVSTFKEQKMTALVYNSNTLKLIDSGDYKFRTYKDAYKQTRRVAWGVFEVKETGKRFAVTNTHLDFLTWNNETNYWDDVDNRLQIIGSEVDEMVGTVNKIIKKYNCPVFSTGDYNTWDNRTDIDPSDPITKIYAKITEEMTDSKFNCESSSVGDMTEIIPGALNQDCISMDMHDGDHIFFKGDTVIKNFKLMSYSYLADISDHSGIFVDAQLN